MTTNRIPATDIIFSHHTQNVEIAVTGNDVEGYTVEWGDYVANEWSEKFATLPVALLRASVLVAIGEETFGEFATMFAHGSEETFAPAATAFLRSEVTE